MNYYAAPMEGLTDRLSLSHEGGMALAFCTLETET